LEFIAGRRWSGSLFPLTPEYIAAGDVWITTGTDGQIAGFVGAAPRECACSSIRRRHRPCAAPRSDEARQGHTGLEQAARRGPADDPLADPNATRFYERGADRRVALGRRCPPPAPAGWPWPRALPGPQIQTSNRRSGGSASSQIPWSSCRRVCGPLALRRSWNGGPAPDSLIRRKNSLMARFNSLQGRIKFPVPMRRELCRKPLNSAIDSEPIVALGGLDEQNSLYFPS